VSDATLGQRLVAESAGTFALVFAGCGAIMVDAKTDALGHVGVAITFGLVIAVMIAALGHVSGAHINPAVTAGFALGRHFPVALVPAYWAAQIVGAIAAALLLRASRGDIGNLGATTPSGSDGQAFLWELVLTAFLMLVILAVATDTRAVSEIAAIAIGGTVGLDAMFGGPITGASMNPARTLGPAIAGGPTDGLWVYLTAPFVGAAIAVGLYAYLARRPVRTAAPTPEAFSAADDRAVANAAGDGP
jgi:MIP family channel proteins